MSILFSPGGDRDRSGLSPLVCGLSSATYGLIRVVCGVTPRYLRIHPRYFRAHTPSFAGSPRYLRVHPRYFRVHPPVVCGFTPVCFRVHPRCFSVLLGQEKTVTTCTFSCVPVLFLRSSRPSGSLCCVRLCRRPFFSRELQCLGGRQLLSRSLQIRAVLHFLAIEVGVRQGSLTFMLSAKVYFSPLSQVT